MTQRVLLVVNCALDRSYENRHVLRALYDEQFDAFNLAVSQTCAIDPAYATIVQSWDINESQIPCPCGTEALGEHTTSIHSLHPRLIDIARHSEDFDYVVFAEDDCLIAPTIRSDWVVQQMAERDVYLPPIEFCPREHTTWVWTQHETGYPAYDRIAHRLTQKQLRDHWSQYSHEGLSHDERTPLFFGFVDFVIFRSEFLRDIASDLATLINVWHEVAIPTAVMSRTSRIGRSNGVALWGEDRQRTLDDLTSLLRQHDFVHPVKLSQYSHQSLCSVYSRIRSELG
jgi:hypothetical protein